MQQIWIQITIVKPENQYDVSAKGKDTSQKSVNLKTEDSDKLNKYWEPDKIEENDSDKSIPIFAGRKQLTLRRSHIRTTMKIEGTENKLSWTPDHRLQYYHWTRQ